MKIGNLEYNTLLWFVMRASLVGISLNNLISIGRQESWVCVLISMVIGFIPLFMFLYFKWYDPKGSLAQISLRSFGWIGRVFNVILVVISFIFVGVIFWDLVSFIRSQFLFNTSFVYISIAFIIPTVYALFKGVRAISKTSLILFYVVVLAILFISLGVIKGVSLDNFKPMFSVGSGNVLYGSLIIIVYNVLPIIFLSSIPRNMIKDYSFRSNVIFYLIAMISLLNAVFLVISVVGIDLSLIYQYPEFHLLKKVQVGEVVGRLESILSMEWIVALFILMVMGLYFIIRTIRVSFGGNEKTSKILIMVTCLLLVVMVNCFPLSNMIMEEFIRGKFMVIMGLTFFGIPLVILVKCFYDQNGHAHDHDDDKNGNYKLCKETRFFAFRSFKV